MRILVISDVHANLNALQAVLAHAAPYDAVWCLGDLIGYGPDPNEVVETIRNLPSLICVAGNHDVAIADDTTNLDIFNPHAQQSVLWQRKNLKPENREYLLGLPRTPLRQGDVIITHGSPRNPLWEYVLNPFIAHSNFTEMAAPLAFVGHSHVQMAFERAQPYPKKLRIQPEKAIPVHGRELILNPGSVGQPRDEDPRAAYAIYDTEAKTWTPHRVIYDIAVVQERILAQGLPARHAERLAHGW